jgi:hypothetical protein
MMARGTRKTMSEGDNRTRRKIMINRSIISNIKKVLCVELRTSNRK